jgi:Flp pilus assembly protein TadG
MICQRGCASSKRSGVATIEFAFVAVVLVFLTIGMVETARGMMVKETLSNAARRGCRTGILPTATNSAVQTDITNVLTAHNIKSADAPVKILVNDKEADVSTAKQNDKISVKVSVPVSKVCWITPLFLAGSNYESEAVVMMRQR